jgi:hypothetical protein
MSASISHGNSGGPVFDTHGDVVGLVVLMDTRGNQVNFALGGNELKVDSGIPLAVAFGAPADAAAADNNAGAGSASGPAANPPSNAATISPEAAEVGALQTDVRALNLTGQAVNLVKAPTFEILVKPVPGDLDGVSTDDVRQWVDAELARSAPTAITHNSGTTSGNRWIGSPVALMRADDAIARSLAVGITYLKAPDGLIIYNVDLGFVRASITPSGRGPATVYSDATTGAIGSSYNASEQLHDVVQGLVRRFADAWVTANRPNPPAATP